MKLKDVGYEVLKNAAKISSSYRELYKNIGNKSGSGGKYFNDKVKQLCDKWKIDISHFTSSFPGSTKYTSMIGKKYGRLRVIELKSINKNIVSLLYALCKCDCGNIVETEACNLRKLVTRSCGCLRKESYKCGEAHHSWYSVGLITSYIFNKIKASATVRALDFNITREYMWELFQKQNGKCVFSGIDLTFGSVDDKKTTTASLDRIDNNKGYVEGNVQWVHKEINFMRGQMTVENFLKACELISNYNKRC